MARTELCRVQRVSSILQRCGRAVHTSAHTLCWLTSSRWGCSQVRRSLSKAGTTPGTCQEFKGFSVAYLRIHLPASAFILKFQTVYYVEILKIPSLVLPALMLEI